jgi:hypothetical protein
MHTRSSLSKFLGALTVAMFALLPGVALAGSCQGSASPPANHCVNGWGTSAVTVNNCRCSGSTAASCGPTGSYYCNDAQGRKIKVSQGTACQGNCSWHTIYDPATDPESSKVAPATAEGLTLKFNTSH